MHPKKAVEVCRAEAVFPSSHLIALRCGRRFSSWWSGRSHEPPIAPENDYFVEVMT